MTRWIAFLNLFDFTLNYVPADKHKVPDGLSRRPANPGDSDVSDVDQILEKFVGLVQQQRDERPFKVIASSYRPLPLVPFGTFSSVSCCCAISMLGFSPLEEQDSDKMWVDIKAFFKTGVLPENATRSLDDRKKFIRKTRRFVLFDDRLWLTTKDGKPPRLLVEDIERRKQLISEAHNDTGHRGRDATFRLLTDRVPYEPTWNTEILRRFDLDTVHMEPGYGGKHFLLQALEPSIDWPEARAATANDSKTWAKFLYEDIICRFG
ncbi:hypothetical protein M378DRAFT_49536, partial [Amanita muscaria Koide BX008]